MTRGFMANLLDQFRKAPMAEIVVQFLSSLQEDMWIAKYDVWNSIAHNIMLTEERVVAPKDGALILQELWNIWKLIEKGEFELDPQYEDIHPYIEQLVIDKIGIEVGGQLHTGRSRNDQVATDIRMKIREELNLLTKHLITLVLTLIEKSYAWKECYIPLYTHLQRGQLGTFAHFLHAYAFQSLRILERINETYQRINRCPLGACAIGGTSVAVNRETTAELLGFDHVIFNSMDAISSRDFISECLAILSDLATIQSRIAEDMIIWNSKEFQFVILDDRYASVSSVMPQKKNPDTLEIIRGRTGKVYGALFEALTMQKGTPSGYNRDFQESKPPLIRVFPYLQRSTQILTGIFDTLKINAQHMKNAATQSFVLSLDLAELLVKEYHLSFREAHHIVGYLTAEENEESTADLIEKFTKARIEEAILKITKKEIEIDESLLKQVLNFEKSLALRKSQGSPSIENFSRGTQILKERIQQEIRLLKERTEKINTAFELTKERCEKIIRSEN